jgi:hypothetical protein
VRAAHERRDHAALVAEHGGQADVFGLGGRAFGRGACWALCGGFGRGKRKEAFISPLGMAVGFTDGELVGAEKLKLSSAWP